MNQCINRVREPGQGKIHFLVVAWGESPFLKFDTHTQNQGLDVLCTAISSHRLVSDSFHRVRKLRFQCEVMADESVPTAYAQMRGIGIKR